MIAPQVCGISGSRTPAGILQAQYVEAMHDGRVRGRTFLHRAKAWGAPHWIATADLFELPAGNPLLRDAIKFKYRLKAADRVAA